MQHNGWDHALEVTAEGAGLVGHAGAVLLRKAADQAGLTAWLGGALRKAGSSPVFDRGAVLVSLAAAGAMLSNPQAVTVDAAGDLYIADAGNNRVQEIPARSGTWWGQSMTAGDIYTVAGSATSASGYTGDGGPAASALLNLPRRLSLDKAGDLFIADTGNNRVQEVPAAVGTWWGQSMTAGDMYTIAGSATGTAGTSGNGGAARSALLNVPGGVTSDPAGNLYIADGGNNRIQEIAAATGSQRGTAMTKERHLHHRRQRHRQRRPVR